MPRIVPTGYALPAGTVGMIRLMDMYVYVWVCSAAAGVLDLRVGGYHPT